MEEQPKHEEVVVNPDTGIVNTPEEYGETHNPNEETWREQQ